MEAMNDRQKAIVSLKIVFEICSQASSALASDNARSEAPIDLATIRKDLTSLLLLIYNATTKLSIALNPTSQTWEACISPLKDLTTYVPALSRCVMHFDSNLHGSTLSEEAVSNGKQVIGAVGHLVNMFLGMALGSHDGSDYLLRTGEVHDLIERAKKTSDNNIEAVRKRLDGDLDGLNDALKEVGVMIGEEDQDTYYEDGWDELGISSASKLEGSELDRASKVHTLLRSTVLMQRRVVQLMSLPSCRTSPHLDELPPLSASILEVTDNLVSNLDTPQDTASISAELDRCVKDMKMYGDAMLDSKFWSSAPELSLEERLGKLDVQGETAYANDRQVQDRENEQWFRMCLRQIYVAGEALAASLGSRPT